MIEVSVGLYECVKVSSNHPNAYKDDCAYLGG